MTYNSFQSLPEWSISYGKGQTGQWGDFHVTFDCMTETIVNGAGLCPFNSSSLNFYRLEAKFTYLWGAILLYLIILSPRLPIPKPLLFGPPVSKTTKPHSLYYYQTPRNSLLSHVSNRPGDSEFDSGLSNQSLLQSLPCIADTKPISASEYASGRHPTTVPKETPMTRHKCRHSTVWLPPLLGSSTLLCKRPNPRSSSKSLHRTFSTYIASQQI